MLRCYFTYPHVFKCVVAEYCVAFFAGTVLICIGALGIWLFHLVINIIMQHMRGSQKVRFPVFFYVNGRK
jgi:hypothetical protein